MSTLSKSPNLGERLEEARKRKGISLREAAEATKIRSDYLQSMENNVFDIALPPIYQRGFLRNYAKFLKLDPEKVMSDYEALQIALNRTPRRDSKGEPLGRMDIADGGTAPQPAADTRQGTDIGEREVNEPAEFDKTLWLKIGLIAGCCSLLALLIVLVVRMVGQNEDAGVATVSAQNGQYVAQPIEGATTNATKEIITLIASDSVTVIVEQASDNTRLFVGTLNAGEQRQVEKAGEVIIRYTVGSALEVEKGGRRYKMGTGGTGYSRLP